MKNNRFIIRLLVILCMTLSLLAITVTADTAFPSNTSFVMAERPVSVSAAYSIDNTNYLQLRAIAALLNGTSAQFNVEWDGSYAVIEPGKPYAGATASGQLQNTTDIRTSTTSFKMNGEVFTFTDARLIGGDTNYLQLREFAGKMSGTASQFNVYWDSAAGQAVIIPGAAYTGVKPAATPTTTSTGGNYREDDIVWIGSVKDYAQTLDAYFDAYGLRKVPVGDLKSDGTLANKKFGIVNREGSWIAQPIYDEIIAYYLHENAVGNLVTAAETERSTESIFIGGYVQAVRNQKMGLLDTSGNEVVPCQYDAVGLPVEGVCRLIAKTNGKVYIGYWNLELGREIVVPNRYTVDTSDATAAGYPILMGDDYKDVGNGQYFARYDFNSGYALVNTGKTETVTHAYGGGIYGMPSTYEKMPALGWDVTQKLVYAQIIDKNGKEILPTAYPYLDINQASSYPQTGPYLIYRELSTKLLVFHSDQDVTSLFYSHLESGVVGSSGILIKASYHAGIVPNGIHPGWRPGDPQLSILPEASLVITAMSPYERQYYDNTGVGTAVIDLSSGTVLPASSDRFTSYNAENNVIIRDIAYHANGTKISDQKLVSGIVNGYAAVGNPKSNGPDRVNGILSLVSGTVYTGENFKGYECSAVSLKDTVWIKKGLATGAKWGLIHLNGSVILPFIFDEVAGMNDDFIRSDGAFTIVKQNGLYGMYDASGNELLPCQYRSITNPGGDYLTIQDNATAKWGIYSRKLGRITLPCQLDRLSLSYWTVASSPVKSALTVTVSASMTALFDLDTGKQLTPAFLTMKPFSRGLFINSSGDCYGPDGKVVFPRSENGADLTLIVRDGKVGYINASRLLREGQPLPSSARKKPETKPMTPKCYLITYPEKRLYTVGEGFDVTGLVVHYADENGARQIIDSSKLTFVTSKTVVLTPGRPFTTDGIKNIEVRYGEMLVDTFEVKVIGSDAGDNLATGEYYLQIYGKYLYPVLFKGTYYIELSDTKPDKPFAIKFVDYSEERGPRYTISYEGAYIAQPSSSDGDQLQSSGIPHMWRINQYSTFITIRDYGNQKLVVNASGQKKANGTKVIIWSSTGTAPDNARITRIKVN